MKTFPVVKCVIGLTLIIFALPRLDWSSKLEMIFSALWLFFAILYVIANWHAWRQTGMTVRLQKEYQWRQAWLQRKRHTKRLDRLF